MEERIFSVISEQLEFAVWVSQRHLVVISVFHLVAFLFLRSVFSVNKPSCFNFCNYHSNEKVIWTYIAYKSESWFPTVWPVHGTDCNTAVSYAGTLCTHSRLSEWSHIHCLQCVKQLYHLFPLKYICQDKKCVLCLDKNKLFQPILM